MDYYEAVEWLKGNRSMMNFIPYDPMDWWVRTAKADAAMMKQAYWIVKAHKEGLLKEDV